MYLFAGRVVRIFSQCIFADQGAQRNGHPFAVLARAVLYAGHKAALSYQTVEAVGENGVPARKAALAEADGDDELTDPEVVMAAKRLFGAARNTEEGASVTIFAVIDDYCPVDVYFSIRCELIDMCDMRIELPFPVSPGRRKPVIDVGSSYAIGEENLLSAEQLAVASRVRERVDECSLGSERVAAYAASADLNGFADACRRLVDEPSDD